MSLVFAALLAHAQGVSPEAPAAEPPPSLWDYIEPGAGAPPANVRDATEELAAERAEELAIQGLLGAPPPTDYYRDPFEATEMDPLHLDRVNPAEFDIPIAVNDMVKGWMQYFLGRGRKYYTRYLERSTKWLPMMYAQIDARGLPRDLVYLSMIESGFSPGALSYASAAGLWQFMPATGRQYGLRVDWWLDERRDPEKATRAALDYLTYLRDMFDGNWFLAWASYNGGEGRVMSATRRYGTTDFWEIVKKDALHSETENYVPKLIAAALLGKHPERYGFVGLRYQPTWNFDRVQVPAGTSIEAVAKCAGMTEEEVLEYNPSLRRWALPPDPETVSVRIVAGKKVAFQEAFAKLPPAERVSFTEHVVKRGESLGAIARKYGVSSDDIVRVNRLKSANHIAVGQRLVIPGGELRSTEGRPPESKPADPKPADPKPADPKPTSTATVATTTAKPASTSSSRTYVVQRGDTLASIAQRNGVSLADLRAWNAIKDADEIYAGQKLTLKGGATPPPATTSYTVRSGDTLSGIAGKHGVTVAQLQAWNNLTGSTITVGRELVVKGGTTAAPTSKTTTYTVKRGDTLGSIADRYNCSVAELKSWNGLSGSTIYPGQKLKIKE